MHHIGTRDRGRRIGGVPLVAFVPFVALLDEFSGQGPLGVAGGGFCQFGLP